MEGTNLHTGATPASLGKRESFGSAVSWGAVLAGAFVAAATYLMLLLAGAGFGFASMSPWGDEGASARTLGIGVIIWLVIIQIISAGLGGYIAGRMRTKWVDVHSDEVFFRDTAHGFLVWAVAAVVSAFLLGSGVSSAVSGAAKVGAGAVSGVGAAAVSAAASASGNGGGAGGMQGQSTQYFVDTLFRSDRPDAAQGDAAKAEVGRIVAVSIARGSITPEDKTYVARVISTQAGVDQPTAEKRIDDAMNRARQTADEAARKAREAADQARKAAVGFALWAFISMLIGAFSSTYAATRGGRTRDAVL
jgi:hypothetical protein